MITILLLAVFWFAVFVVLSIPFMWLSRYDRKPADDWPIWRFWLRLWAVILVVQLAYTLL